MAYASLFPPQRSARRPHGQPARTPFVAVHGDAVKSESVYACTRLPSLTRQLAEYLGGVAARPLPADVLERTKLHLLDTLAAMISGATLDAGQCAIRYVRQEGAATD